MTLYTKYPGNGYVYVICDVCGGKFHQKDTVLIKDSWNLQNNLVVCRKDVDKANAQLRPSTTYEKPVPYPEKLRPPQKDQYVSNSIAAQLPSAPQQLTATINPLNGDRKSTRLNSSHTVISYAVFCLKKKNTQRVRIFARDGQAHRLAGLATHLLDRLGDRQTPPALAALPGGVGVGLQVLVGGRRAFY